MGTNEQNKLSEGIALITHYINKFESIKDFTLIREDRNLIKLTFFTGDEIDKFFFICCKTINEKKVFINTITLLENPGLRGNFNENGILYRNKISMSKSEVKNNLITIFEILNSNFTESYAEETTPQNTGTIIKKIIIEKGNLITGAGNLLITNHNETSNNEEKAAGSNEQTAKKGNKIAIIGIIITSFIGIFTFTFPLLVDHLLTSPDSKTTSNEDPMLNYFISLSVSDTISSDLELAKKIVVTASADTENMIITSESSTGIYGPFNMNMETARRYNFIAVFYEVGTYTVTITAYSKDGDTASESIVIEA